MNDIEEVATANRESPRPVSQEKKTDSGTETAISAPDPSAVNATKQALLNAAGTIPHLFFFGSFHKFHSLTSHES